jgi:hypothetical protein
MPPRRYQQLPHRTTPSGTDAGRGTATVRLPGAIYQKAQLVLIHVWQGVFWGIGRDNPLRPVQLTVPG